MDNVMYRRPKASEMLQGMLDTVYMLDLETRKFASWYPQEMGLIAYNTNWGSFQQSIQHVQGQVWQMSNAVKILEEKGL